MRVVFVCSGNICRSAMAAGYLKHRVEHRGPAGVEVDSCGTLGIEGAPASVEAIEVMAEIGVDLRSHSSRGARPQCLADADVVVAMTREHLQELAARFRMRTAHRYLLRAFEKGPVPDPEAGDLIDPVGARLEVFRGQRATIVSAVDHLATWIERLA